MDSQQDFRNIYQSNSQHSGPHSAIGSNLTGKMQPLSSQEQEGLLNSHSDIRTSLSALQTASQYPSPVGMPPYDSNWYRGQNCPQGPGPMERLPQTGPMQGIPPGHPPYHPRFFYGYYPGYPGFMNNMYADYLAMDPSLFLRRQKPRTVFSSDQLKILEAVFKENNYPDAAKRKDVANVTGLPVDRVRVWFQNRRAKEKRLTEDRLALSLLKNEMRVTERANVSPPSGECLSPNSFQEHLDETATSSCPMDVNQNNQTVSTESHVKQTHKTTDKSEKSEEDVIRALVLEAKAKDEARKLAVQAAEAEEMEQDVCEEDPSARKESGNIHPYNYSKSADQKVADIELANRVYQQHLRLMEENARLAKHGITSHSSVNIDKE